MAAVLATGCEAEVAVVAEKQGADDERAFIARAQRSDTAAFEALYRMHVGKVYGLCLRMTGNASEAEDCTQDAFIQAWQKLDRFRGDSAFATWMHRVAVNTVLGRMRRSKREHDRLQAAADLQPEVATNSNNGGLEDLQQAIDTLPRGARHVFVLHAVYGFSHEETGSMLGIASGTSKAQLHRAKRLLASQLDTDGVRG